MASKTEALAGLLLNVLVLPGIGTVIWGDRTHGIWQLVLTIVGVPLSLLLIGIPMVLAAWIWALISGIEMVQEAEE